MGIVLPFAHLSVLVYKAVQHKQWLIFSTPISVRSADVVWLFLKMQWTILMTKHFGPIVYFSRNHHSGWICPYGSDALTQSSHLSSACVSGSRWASARWEHRPRVPGLQSSRWHFVLPFALQPACHHALHLFSLPLVFLCCFLHLQNTRFLTLHIIHCWSYWFSVH